MDFPAKGLLGAHDSHDDKRKRGARQLVGAHTRLAALAFKIKDMGFPKAST